MPLFEEFLRTPSLRAVAAEAEILRFFVSYATCPTLFGSTFSPLFHAAASSARSLVALERAWPRGSRCAR